MLDYIKLFDQLNKVAPLRKFEIILTAGLAMAGTVAIFLIGKDKLLSFLSQFEHHSFTYNQTLSFLLFIFTVMLAFFWVASVLLEILWVDRYYKNLMPPPPNGAIFIAMLVGGFIVVLAYLSDSILNYSSCYLIFALVNLLSDATSSNEVDKALVSYEMSVGGSLSEDLKKGNSALLFAATEKTSRLIPRARYDSCYRLFNMGANGSSRLFLNDYFNYWK